MPTSVPETIAGKIVERLEQITTGNGYTFTAASVDRTQKFGKGWRPQHLGIVVEQGDSEPNEELNRPGNPPAVAFNQTYLIHGIVLSSDEATTPDETTGNDMEAAIKSAIADASDWVFFEDNAVQSVFAGSQLINTDTGDMGGVTVTLVVTYRVSELDHYTVRQ